MSKVYVTRRARFNAAHRLHNPAMSDEWNQKTYGKCNNPNWHGHNYILEVTVVGIPDGTTGYVMDLSELGGIVNSRIVEKCDHRNLNLEVDFLVNTIPSTENLAVAFWRELENEITGGRLYSVKLFETDNNMVEYRGE